MSAPKTTNQWLIEGLNDFDSLQYKKDVPIPELGSDEVLVKSKQHLESHKQQHLGLTSNSPGRISKLS
jgi:hypothetical protein